MGSALRKFINRAPRYMLQAHDNQIMRYSAGSAGEVFRTRLLNISETGAAFVVDFSMAPKIGDIMKVELPIPGFDQIAWFGRVVRIEEHPGNVWWSDPDPFLNEDKMLVAIRFEELPEAHRGAIARALEIRMLEELRLRRFRQQKYFLSWFTTNSLKAIGYLLLCAMSFSILYYLSRPTETYDASRGTPWGKRFQFFEFEKNSR